MRVDAQEIAYRDDDTELLGILFSQPDAPRPTPGILLVHAGGGLDDHAKSRAQSLAESGFVVLACDMYGKGVAGNRERVMATLMALRNDPGKLCRRARAGLRVLEAQPQIDGRFAAVGYCFGGMTVLQLARAGEELAGVVSVHGSLATSLAAKAGAVKAKVLVLHGALDPHVPMEHVTAFAEEMKQAGADWQLTMYGGAMHGFTHQNAFGMPGVAYNAAADARSTIAVKDFLTELFGPIE